jgi:hypothetical protein
MRRRIRVKRVFPALGILLLVLFPLIAAYGKEADFDGVLKTVCEAKNLSACLEGKIWPGENLLAVPVLIVDRGKKEAVLANHPGNPDGFTPSTRLSRLGLRVLYYPENYPDAAGAANTARRVAGAPTLTVLRESLETPAGSTEKAVQLLFHESYHVYQEKIGLHGPNENLSQAYPRDQARVKALRTLEGRLLFDALQEGKPARDILLALLGARSERAGLLEPRFAEFESQMEMHEGLADYTGWKALLLAAGMKDYRAALDESESFHRYQGVNQELSPYLLVLKFVGVRDRIPLRTSFYHTGCGYAMLLDKVEPDWKAGFVSNPRPLHELVSEAVGAGAADEKERRDALEKAKAKYKFSDLVKTEEAYATERKAELTRLRDSVEANPEGLLVIDAYSLKSASVEKSWDPNEEVALSEVEVFQKRHLHTRLPGLFDLDFAGPVIWRTEDMVFLSPLAGDWTIRVDGQPISIPLPDDSPLLLFGKRVEIRAGHASLTFEPEAELEVSRKEKAIQVRVWKKEK